MFSDYMERLRQWLMQALADWEQSLIDNSHSDAPHSDSHHHDVGSHHDHFGGGDGWH